MDQQTTPRWLQWAQELQLIGQAGCTYSKNEYDIERFQRIIEIAAEMAADHSSLTHSEILDIFGSDKGYQTPKMDTRAAIFQNDQILLVKERNAKWAMPGGWVDANQSIRTNTIKEVKEEAGLNVEPIRLIALHDRNLHNLPPYFYGICKVFVLCRLIDGKFEPNLETTESGYFTQDNLPPLAVDKNTAEQIQLCFQAKDSENWAVQFD